MRGRQHTFIDRQTGDISVTTEVIDDDADFEQRIAELKASMPELQPGDVCFAMATCNGCGATAEVDYDNPRLPDGWAATEAGDFCPRCQSLNLCALRPVPLDRVHHFKSLAHPRPRRLVHLRHDRLQCRVTGEQDPRGGHRVVM
jgi:hypothetical protein